MHIFKCSWYRGLLCTVWSLLFKRSCLPRSQPFSLPLTTMEKGLCVKAASYCFSCWQWGTSGAISHLKFVLRSSAPVCFPGTLTRSISSRQSEAIKNDSSSFKVKRCQGLKTPSLLLRNYSNCLMCHSSVVTARVDFHLNRKRPRNKGSAINCFEGGRLGNFLEHENVIPHL